jgi:hypothetical protein
VRWSPCLADVAQLKPATSWTVVEESEVGIASDRGHDHELRRRECRTASPSACSGSSVPTEPVAAIPPRFSYASVSLSRSAADGAGSVVVAGEVMGRTRECRRDDVTTVQSTEGLRRREGIPVLADAKCASATPRGAQGRRR